MGMQFKNYREEMAYYRRVQEQEDLEVSQRMALADKIVMVMVDTISHDILRPGPEAAERECYIVAKELRDHSPVLRELVVKILEVDESE